MRAWGTSSGYLLKGLVAACLVYAAVPAYHLSALAYLRANEPEAAFRLHPDDALAASAVIGPSLAVAAQVQLAPSDLQSALRARPLTADLIAVQGLLLDAQGNSLQALATMQLTNRASRRIAIANLWLIEAASASGDVPATVANYHAALTVHPELDKLLLPILAAGVTYPEVREALKPYLAQPNRWAGVFLDEVIKQVAPAELAALLQPLPDALRAEDYQARLAAILHRITVEEGPGAAVSLARQIIPGLPSETLTNLGLSPETRDQRLGPLAWNLLPSDQIAVNVGEGQVLEVVAQPLSRGQIAVRDLLVDGGHSYVLTQRVSLASESGKIGLRWSAACVSMQGVTPFWDQHIPVSREPVRYNSVVKVPSGCNVARLILHAAGPDGQFPATILIGELRWSRLLGQYGR